MDKILRYDKACKSDNEKSSGAKLILLFFFNFFSHEET